MTSTAEIPAGLRAQYQRARRGDGGPLPARYALAIARERGKSVEDYGWTEEKGRYSSEALIAERDGFTLRATWTYDDMGLEDMGYGSVDQERGGDRWAVPIYQERGTFLLASGQNTKDWYHPADAEGRYEWMRKAGASKQTADEWMREAARSEARAAGEATEYVITVTASKAGVELGSAAMGGFGMDSDDGYYTRQIAAGIEETDLVANAIDEARQTLATLREEDE